jgi:hypothetical protein
MATTFACDMTAIPAAERPAHHQLTRRLIDDVATDIRELPDGFSLHFPPDDYPALAEFVARERLCCPFLTFSIEVMPDQGPLVLRLTGPDGAKEFIRAELGL